MLARRVQVRAKPKKHGPIAMPWPLNSRSVTVCLWFSQSLHDDSLLIYHEWCERCFICHNRYFKIFIGVAHYWDNASFFRRKSSLRKWWPKILGLNFDRERNLFDEKQNLTLLKQCLLNLLSLPMFIELKFRANNLISIRMNIK